MADTMDPKPYDYTFVSNPARIACYDDLHSAPRVTVIEPDTTNEFIEKLTTTIYEQAKLSGGAIPYTPIREVTENFIHAQFSEVIVSILDKGNTIRFADQGPGITQKEKAQLPGFSSATEGMKKYIRGVGSGLPLVKEYLEFSHGTITIEDNLRSGAVVTISLSKEPKTEVVPEQNINIIPVQEPVATFQQVQTPAKPEPKKISIPVLSEREILFIQLLYSKTELRVTDFVKLTSTSNSTAHNTLKKLQEAGIVTTQEGKRRILTPYGLEIAQNL